MDDMKFKPAWWLRNPHLQTMWPTLCRRPIKNLPLRRERFELPDGDFVDLDWAGSGNGPIVLVLHGFEGSIDSSYAKGMLLAIKQQGWRGVFMHFRGCSGEHNRKPHSYHSGDTGDVAEVVKEIKLREPDTLLAAVGFSLGGNVLLKWLGETRDQNPLHAAIAISVPFELHKAADKICQGFSRFYQWYMLRSVQKRLEQKFLQQPPPIKFPPFSQLRTIRDFDDKVTAPMHGFSGVQEYYTLSSSRQFLQHIRVPTLLLHAKDDPFMTQEVIPHPHELSEVVRLEVTETGGHVGFVTGKFPWRAEYWLEQRVPIFLRECFSVKKELNNENISGAYL
jgi:predicted alpha/beta-fold hydrolase